MTSKSQCDERHRTLRWWLASVALAAFTIAVSIAGIMYNKINGNTQKSHENEVSIAKGLQHMESMDNRQREMASDIKELLKEAKK